MLGAHVTSHSTCTGQGTDVTSRGRRKIAGWKAPTDSLIDDVHVTAKATHNDQ